jgi:hypothetical protein
MKLSLIPLLILLALTPVLSQVTDSIPPVIALNRIKVMSVDKGPLMYFCLPDSCKLPAVFKTDSMSSILFYFKGTVKRDPKKVMYKTRLEGRDDVWTEITKEGFVEYKKLSPGSYVLNVHACNSSGVWNYEPFRFKFVVN